MWVFFGDDMVFPQSFVHAEIHSFIVMTSQNFMIPFEC